MPIEVGQTPAPHEGEKGRSVIVGVLLAFALMFLLLNWPHAEVQGWIVLAAPVGVAAVVIALTTRRDVVARASRQSRKNGVAAGSAGQPSRPIDSTSGVRIGAGLVGAVLVALLFLVWLGDYIQ